MIDQRPYVFPSTDRKGLLLRDYFAAKAMQGILSTETMINVGESKILLRLEGMNGGKK